MPNWVKQNILFIGKQEQIDKLFETISSTDSTNTQHIDFEKIIPMPDSLRISSGSSTDLGIDILSYQQTGDDKALRERLSWSWVTSAGIKNVDDLINYCIEKGIADLHEGQKALDNIKLYGCKDWYNWSVNNWGTKWYASDSEKNGNTLTFQTAWSLPEPILVKLSEMFPEVTMHVEYADEDIGSNCGEFELLNGVISYYNPYDGPKACEVWGYDPAEYFPDILRDRRIDQILKKDE